MNCKILLPILAVLAVTSCGSRSGNQQPAGGFPGAPAANVTPSVEVVTATARDVAQESTYSSTVEAYATNNIMPQTGARIRKINVEVGDYVAKGQVLAEMDRFQLEQLELQIQNDEVEFARLKGLFEEGGVSQSDFEAAELGYKVRKTNYQNLLENTILRSPINGYVTARNFDVGDMFAMSAPLFTVQQVVPVKLLVGISENEYTKVKKGDVVSLTVDALPGRTFSGKINRLYPTINAATHTFNAEVIVSNGDRALRPGMFARVTVNFGTNHRIVLPDRCIVKQEGTGQRFVYLLREDDTVNYVPVTLGRHIGSEYEVVEGVQEGETVVSKGQAALKDGVKVQILNEE
ncbi:MAG: efflux RND transporter periplasmic adaptor subunit [Bacteroidales bacterium]|jgi:RND family efflux transporter MFP subunit|nr:efflux RND transporter periplasmic adaptor subunit [Bacteroidales bacterium]